MNLKLDERCAMADVGCAMLGVGGQKGENNLMGPKGSNLCSKWERLRYTTLLSGITYVLRK
ncbi:hypothetical protein [Algoriphagus winogradskyi]|uniref:Uncharacterized protein n=1 Tax=Algoriphagus winogradskyi TaxID=237017 RepID=A0ABY1PNN4_9BACT|nr:hypothetical protein [Algoriphagus winogradskyi]SMP36177.1 hypothetical protein SAMN06265367_11246 [Algoriphagus winogradskyi]